MPLALARCWSARSATCCVPCSLLGRRRPEGEHERERRPGRGRWRAGPVNKRRRPSRSRAICWDADEVLGRRPPGRRPGDRPPAAMGRDDIPRTVAPTTCHREHASEEGQHGAPPSARAGRNPRWKDLRVHHRKAMRARAVTDWMILPRRIMCRRNPRRRPKEHHSSSQPGQGAGRALHLVGECAAARCWRG